MTPPSHSEYRAHTGRLRAGEYAFSGLANSAIFQSVVIALLVYLSLSGQPAVAIEKTDDIDTNRPSFMFSPLVVPNGSLQLENGALYSHLRHGTNVVDVPEMQLRLGVFKNTEFQMFVPNIFIGHTEGSHLTSTRLSHIGEVGIKRQIPFKRLQLSLIGSINIPTGSTSLVGSGVQPVLRMPWGVPIKTWEVMGMQSILVLNDGRDVQYQQNAMITKTIKRKVSVFAEYVGFFTNNIANVNIAHMGTTYRPQRHHQFDAHVGLGLNRAAPSVFAGGGYSYRFDNLPWGGPAN